MSNIMEEYISFSKKCIIKYLKRIMGKHYNQDVCNDLIKVYIDTRYYNQYDSVYDTFEDNIRHYLLETTLELVQDKRYSDEDKEMIKKTVIVFKYIMFFDNVMDCPSAKDLIDKIAIFQKKELGIEDEKFSDEFFTILKDDLNRRKVFIDKMESKDFKINYEKTNISKVYNTSLEHFLKFPKIYSKFAIDNAYKSKKVTENKLFVIYPMVVAKILEDIIAGDFERNYLVDFTDTLFEKPKKFKRLFNLINDNIVKEKMTIKISYEEYKLNKKEIVKNMQDGYRYAVIVDGFNAEKNSVEDLNVFKYIVLNNKSSSFKEIEDLDNVIVIR